MPRKAQQTLPVAHPPSPEYGQGVALQQAQQAIPLPNNAGQVAALQQGASQSAQQPGPQPPPGGPQQPPQQQAPQVMAGDMGDFGRPSELPNQSIMHGAASGPGPNNTQLGQIPAPKVSQSIAQLAALTGNPDIQSLAQHAQAQGQ